ncbi:Sphingoid long chain base kinase 5 [Yarrowia sp. B02]|nr:Sphingoid long chain base kinase 5 [Yarrowia sp. B02]
MSNRDLLPQLASLGANGLIVPASNFKTSRTCASFFEPRPDTFEITYENILFAEPSDKRESALKITYGDISKTSCIPKSVTTAFDGDAAALAEEIMQKAYGAAKPKKRFLVLVNPNGGTGHAAKVFKYASEPLLRAANCAIDVIETTHRYHAQEIGAEIPMDKYDAIMCCSGDGIPHEVINGMASRPEDGAQLLQSVAICQLPCGSGNSLSWSLNGTSSASIATLKMIKGRAIPVDYMAVTQGDKRVVSFLSQAWGLVADLDLGTEHLRWMGGARFTVGAIARIINRKTFPCEIAVKVYTRDMKELSKHYQKYIVDRMDPLNSEEIAKLDPNVFASLKYGTVNDPIPSDWEVTTSKGMSNFYTGKMPWVSADSLAFPAAIPHDGLIDVMTWDDKVGRGDAAKLLIASETGHHVDLPYAGYMKIEAFRITPIGPSDYVSIDGESFPIEPYQVEVLPRAGLYLAQEGTYIRSGFPFKKY